MKIDKEITLNAYRCVVPLKVVLNEYAIQRNQSSSLQRTAN